MDRPARLLLQWHLSDRCNLRCAHCYQADYRESADPARWRQVLAEFCRYLAGEAPAERIPGHINVTGGEPFALAGFADLLEDFARRSKEFSFAILSNGVLIDAAWAKALAGWQPRYVQVSLDGQEATHDRLRGPGSFALAVAGIKRLVAAGVPTIIAFTAGRENFREFPAVARLGIALGVRRVWADRLIPAGRDGAQASLTAKESREFAAILQAAQPAKPLGFFGRTPKTAIARHRALQFLAGGPTVYRCTAGDSLLTVLPDGTVYPCRRLPIPVGNIYRQSLADIYRQGVLRQLRDETTVFAGCEDCLYAPLCRGGLRCLAYAATGSLRVADPGCWLAPAAPAPPAAAAAAPAAV